MPSKIHSNLSLPEARKALTEAGFIESTDTPLLGASIGTEGLEFAFLHQGVDADGVIWHREVAVPQRDLATLCSRLEELDRAEPEFDLAQKALSSSPRYHQLQRLRYLEPEEYYALTHPGQAR